MHFSACESLILVNPMILYCDGMALSLSYLDVYMPSLARVRKQLSERHLSDTSSCWPNSPIADTQE